VHRSRAPLRPLSARALVFHPPLPNPSPNHSILPRRRHVRCPARRECLPRRQHCQDPFQARAMGGASHSPFVHAIYDVRDVHLGISALTYFSLLICTGLSTQWLDYTRRACPDQEGRQTAAGEDRGHPPFRGPHLCATVPQPPQEAPKGGHHLMDPCTDCGCYHWYLPAVVRGWKGVLMDGGGG
jgi:hypothetical protein